MFRIPSREVDSELKIFRIPSLKVIKVVVVLISDFTAWDLEHLEGYSTSRLGILNILKVIALHSLGF